MSSGQVGQLLNTDELKLIRNPSFLDDLNGLRQWPCAGLDTGLPKRMMSV